MLEGRGVLSQLIVQIVSDDCPPTLIKEGAFSDVPAVFQCPV